MRRYNKDFLYLNIKIGGLKYAENKQENNLSIRIIFVYLHIENYRYSALRRTPQISKKQTHYLYNQTAAIGLLGAIPTALTRPICRRVYILFTHKTNKYRKYY